MDGFGRFANTHISEIMDKIIELLSKEGKDKDKEAGDLISRQLNMEKNDSSRSTIKGALTNQ